MSNKFQCKIFSACKNLTKKFNGANTQKTEKLLAGTRKQLKLYMFID